MINASAGSVRDRGAHYPKKEKADANPLFPSILFHLFPFNFCLFSVVKSHPGIPDFPDFADKVGARL